jgi:hypothetical protein
MNALTQYLNILNIGEIESLNYRERYDIPGYLLSITTTTGEIIELSCPLCSSDRFDFKESYKIQCFNCKKFIGELNPYSNQKQIK